MLKENATARSAIPDLEVKKFVAIPLCYNFLHLYCYNGTRFSMFYYVCYICPEIHHMERGKQYASPLQSPFIF